MTHYVGARWFRAKDGAPRTPAMPTDAVLARDSDNELVVLFGTPWSLKSFIERNPEFDVSDVPFQ
jgi:peptide subunit release factor RF-3